MPQVASHRFPDLVPQAALVAQPPPRNLTLAALPLGELAVLAGLAVLMLLA